MIVIVICLESQGLAHKIGEVRHRESRYPSMLWLRVFAAWGDCILDCFIEPNDPLSIPPSKDNCSISDAFLAAWIYCKLPLRKLRGKAIS